MSKISDCTISYGALTEVHKVDTLEAIGLAGNLAIFAESDIG